MKPLVPCVASILAAFLLVPSTPAVAAEDDRPNGWLGVLVAPDNVPQEGVRIRGVIEGSPADEVRLRAKDSIVAVDGTAVSSAAELMDLLQDRAPGSFVALSVRRSGHELEKSAVLGTRPTDGDHWKFVRGWLGVEAIQLPASLRAHFGAPDDAGILVSKVVEGSPADDSGIRVGDVVYEADGRPVTSLEKLSQIVMEAGVENDIDVVLARDGARIVVGPRIARAPEVAPR
jgi:serine protease Do